MIEKIAHLADIHIENKKERHLEYQEIFSILYKSLKEDSPDRIVIVGDLFHNFMSISNDAKNIAIDFISELLTIAPVRLTQGNHDTKVNLETGPAKRKDSLTPIAKAFRNQDFIYYDKTGFYVDENITWAVWHHAEKISPWVKYPDHKIEGNQKYIDLFHDPIYGCKFPNNLTGDNQTYVKISDFKGDYSLFGDIHLRQFYNRDKKIFGGYCSSLIQQNYGEKIEKHGYLLWNIKKDSVEEKDIETIYPYINIQINESDNIDYDNLNIVIPNYENYKKVRVKIWWKDKLSNINKNNEKKIVHFLKTKYSNIIQIKFDKTYNKNSIKLSNNDGNNIEISSVSGQQTLFREHLKKLKFEDDIIDDVIKLDNKINSRYDFSIKDTGIDIDIIQIEIDNFRSYGEKEIIDISNLDGITQITGKNGKGKSNILYSILYLFFGKIPSTEKREKFSDSRFINNKRDLNYCQVNGVLCIDDQIYKIERRTELEYKKDKETIKRCSTTVNYYKLDENWDIIDEQSESNKSETKKVIEESIGDYDSFFRKIFTDADTLNKVLSTDRSVFIDSLLADTGLDIFDKKLNEYKSYKKEKYDSEEKIKIDVSLEKEKITDIENEINSINETLSYNKNELIPLNKGVENLQKSKDEYSSKLHQLNPELTHFNEENSKSLISDYQNLKEEKKNELDNIDMLLKNYPDNFDYSNFEKTVSEKDKKKEVWHSIKNIISTKNYELISTKNDIDRLNTEINLVKNQIDEIKNSESQLKENLENKIKILISDGKSYNSELEFRKKEFSSKKDILLIKKKNEEDKKICKFCGDDMSELYPDKLQNIIENIKKIDDEINSLNKLESTDNIINDLKVKIQTKRDEYKTLKLSLDNKVYLKEIDEKVNLKKDELLSLENKLPELNSKLEGVQSSIKNLELESDQLQISLDEVQSELSILDKNKKEYEKGLSIKQNKDRIPLEIENLQYKIDLELSKLELYELEKNKIHQNELTQNKINSLNKKISDKNIRLDFIKNEINKNNTELTLKEKDICIIKEKIEKYEQQQREDFVHKTYVNLLHRDGIPMTLLKNMVTSINKELYTLLENMTFSLYFDDEVNLKMNHDIEESKEQNVLDGSGMERSFIVLALKITLQKISRKNRTNLMILDEITGKLVEDSVENFIEMLHKLKIFISKIFIIEHNHDINPDHIIEVDQDENKISFLKIN